MTAIDELIARARAVWAGVEAPEALRAGTRPAEIVKGASPTLGIAVVACMDARLDPVSVLGLAPGEAHILRNAGGSVTNDMIRSLAVSQRRLGTRAVMLIHHTGCGMLTLTDDEFRAELQADAGVAPTFAIESFTDLDADVRQSILRVRRSTFLPYRDQVRGFVYDVDDGSLREVVVEDE
jgi:carbonic anhydrase